ncbi:MAG: SCO family protein [Longimicrobiales bacterium]|nr:SCO family protein [Longimicrobiales bacterium]
MIGRRVREGTRTPGGPVPGGDRAFGAGSAVREGWAVAALGFLLATTAAWWALALWPLAEGAPEWVRVARDVCFNARDNGLPDRAGWILLVGEPLGMLAVLLVGWRDALAGGLRRLVSSLPGRLAALAVAGGVALGLGATVTRLAAGRVPDPTPLAWEVAPTTYPRLDREWVEVAGLVDHRGRPFSRAGLQGRPALVTFAFGHCTTVCPLVVKAALDARAALRGEVDLAVVALTLDPWRDTPSRLPEMAAAWGLEEGDFLVGGTVEAVEAALDAWNVARERDDRTGEILHPALTFLVAADGTVRYATAGSREQIEALARRLEDS